MKKTARQILIDHLASRDLQIPISGSVRAFCRELADLHGYTPNAYRHVYYDLLDDEEEEEDPALAPAEISEEPPSAPVGLSTLDRDYFYNELADLYIVWLPHRARAIQVEGETVREMKKAYSAMPAGYDTINQICEKFGWRRKDFVVFKQALGWTHDQDPFTDEEHASRPTPDLVADYASMKRGEFERQLRKKEWAETIEAARRWEEWQRLVGDPLSEYIHANPPRSREQIARAGAKKSDPFLAVFSPADAHLHKKWADGQGFVEVRRDLLQTTEDLISRVLQRGTPDRVILILGNDWWHVDNIQGNTTRGTSQDVDGLTGPPMVAQGYEVAAEIIDRLRGLSAGGIEVRIVPSNHGEWSDYHLHAGLRFGYRHCADVQIVGRPDHRQFLTYGRNLIGLEHGDGPREQDLPLIMAKEARAEWGRCDHAYWLTAHRHHLKEQDLGVLVMQAPSLAGKDRWHSKKGYCLAERANIAYLFDYAKGHTDRLISIP